MAIDDATGTITSARFETSETKVGYFRLLETHLNTYGRPEQLYSDKYCVFKVNAEEAKDHVTQFTRAMNDLGIEVICANSPQAKGRIERSFKTHQDRLIKLMRLEGISSIEQANEFLRKYVVEHNNRFSIKAQDPTDAHLPLNSNHELRRILADHESRRITKNLEISWHNQVIQIEAPERANRLIDKRCTIITTLEGELILEYQGEALSWLFLQDQKEETPKVVDSKTLESLEYSSSANRTQPSVVHPWRQLARGHYRLHRAKKKRN